MILKIHLCLWLLNCIVVCCVFIILAMLLPCESQIQEIQDKVASREHRGSIGNKSCVGLLVSGSSAAQLPLASWMTASSLCSRTWGILSTELCSSTFWATLINSQHCTTDKLLLSIFFQQYRTIHWSFGSLLRKIISQLQLQYQQADPITSLVWIIWQQTVNSLWPCRSPQTWKKQNYPSEKQIKLNM